MTDETTSELAVSRPTQQRGADPTHVRLSAAVLLGSLIAAGAGVRVHPEHLDVSASAVFAAIVLFLVCLARYNAASSAAE